jgi:DNA polymerase (family 10)
MKSYNEDFYRVFNEMADLMSLLNDNSFKIRAYREAARRLKENMEPITKKNADKAKFKEIPGVGENIAEKMMQFIKTGKIAALEKLRKQIPKPVRDMLEIPHLGPRRVRDLYINLGIKSKKDLIKCAKNGEIDKLPGFGEKLIGQILSAINKGQEKKHRHERKDVEPIAKKLTGILKKIKRVDQVAVAGSYRRGADTVGDLDILVSGNPKIDEVEKRIYKTFPDHTSLASGETKIAFVIFPQNLQVDIRVVPEESWGAALLYFTGSKDYNVMMRKVAIEKDCLLNEYGLFKDGEYVAGETEEEVYTKLGLPYKDPKNRK